MKLRVQLSLLFLRKCTQSISLPIWLHWSHFIFSIDLFLLRPWEQELLAVSFPFLPEFALWWNVTHGSQRTEGKPALSVSATSIGSGLLPSRLGSRISALSLPLIYSPLFSQAKVILPAGVEVQGTPYWGRKWSMQSSLLTSRKAVWNDSGQRQASKVS